MGKIIITLEDLPDGNVHINTVFYPPVKDSFEELTVAQQLGYQCLIDLRLKELEEHNDIDTGVAN